MTVGVASITQVDTGNHMVLLGADRLLTTHQVSQIEHEHPESKLSKIGTRLPAANMGCVLSGALSLAEELKTNLTGRINTESQQVDPNAIGVQHVADWAAEEHRDLVQEKIESLVLSSYGLEIDDLSRQHQFKDDFLNGILGEVEQVQAEIQENLNMILCGVDTTGAYIFDISNNNKTSMTNPGYATTGSGKQPAQSEFIKAEYSKSCTTSEGLVVCASALYESQQASGVGGQIDIQVISFDINRELDQDIVGELMQREETIVEKQEDIREEEIDDNPVDWAKNL